MSHIIWLWHYLRGRRKRLVAGMALSAITSIAVILNPMIARRLIDEVIIPANTEPLIGILLTMLTIHIARMMLRYVMHCFLLTPSSNEAMTLIRRNMYEMIQNQDFKFLAKFTSGNVMTRMTQDLDRLRHTVAWASFAFIDSVVFFFCTFTFMLFMNWQLTLSLATVTPLIFLVSGRFIRTIRPRFQLLRQQLTKLGTAVTENINGNRVVKAFAREEHEIRNFEKHNAEFRDISRENALIAARYQPVLELLSNMLGIITLTVGGLFLIYERITPGQYLAFSSLTWALANPLRMLPVILADIERFSTSAIPLREILESPKGISDKEGAVSVSGKLKGGVEFKNVSMTIEDNVILEDVSFKVNPGETLGILGSTGAGKTSIINLLTRFYEPDSGEILVDGMSVDYYTLSSLRRSVGVAMQDVFLFSDSVKNNISYGEPDMTEDEIKVWAYKANADEFIEKMEDKYETLIGERGVGISGGQKQRISLARALAVKPPILILDDTTSAVDSETEQFIQEEMRNLSFNCTKIIIAQRISSFRGADHIIVMDQGKIIERGNHAELLENRGFYHHIYNLQHNEGDKE